MACSSLIPPHVFMAYSKKHNDARIAAMRQSLKLQVNVTHATPKLKLNASQFGYPLSPSENPRNAPLRAPTKLG